MLKENFKFNLYIGFNDKDLHYQLYSDSVMIRTIKDVLDEYIQCYTIHNTTGVYNGESESGCIITICSDTITINEIKLLVDVLKVALNQEVIYVEQSIINGGLL